MVNNISFLLSLDYPYNFIYFQILKGLMNTMSYVKMSKI
jgi:hypothetical protein